MFKRIVLAIALMAMTMSAENRVFEMRTYTCNPGKLDALLTRFRDHTTALFEKHGMTNIGYWIPKDVPHTLIYILAYPNREEATKAWKEFSSDPEWQKVRSESEANGKIVEKVDSKFMDPADFSKIK